jgi:hypothetical protein
MFVDVDRIKNRTMSLFNAYTQLLWGNSHTPTQCLQLKAYTLVFVEQAVT